MRTHVDYLLYSCDLCETEVKIQNEPGEMGPIDWGHVTLLDKDYEQRQYHICAKCYDTLSGIIDNMKKKKE